MRVESLQCNNCGAPLDVAEDANFLTCNHCGTQLVVRRTESATYTEKSAATEARLERMGEELARFRYQNALTGIEKDWAYRRERYMTKTKGGQYVAPSVAGAVISGTVFIGFGLFCMLGGIAIGRMTFIPFLGLFLILMGCGAAAYQYTRAKAYLAAEKAYRLRKMALTIDSFRDEDAPSRAEPSVPDSPPPHEFLSRLERGEA